MDVFRVERPPLSAAAAAPEDALAPEVSFDAGSEFNLCFFEEGSAHGFSDDPGSVESAPAPSPPPGQPGPQGEALPDDAAGAPSTVKQEQHYVAADSNTSSSTKTIVPCKVCGDKASGYHYGVTSCEGCKGFFRRSIQKQIEYRCLRDGKCLVIRLNRNRCQYCRFKKCLAVGMSRDSVRYGRVPKRSRERGDEAAAVRVSATEGECSPPPPAAATPPPPPAAAGGGAAEPGAAAAAAAARRLSAGDDTIAAVAQAHRAHCAYTAEAGRAAARRPLAPPPPPPPVADADAATSTADALEHERCWLWQHFAANITPSVQRVVEFAKRVPGFCDLGQDDQLILIKVGFLEIWLTHVARLTTATALTFEDGTTVTRQQLETMYDNDFATSLTQFATSLNSLSLSDSEVGLFSAVVLLTADRPGVTDVKAVEHYQDRLIDALKLQIGRNHTNESQVFSSLLIKLPELRNLGAKHNAHLDWFRANWQKVALPPLFAEIFDIPKSEDDVQ